MTRSIRGSTAGLALLLLGCAFGPRFTAPTLSVVGVQVEASDLWEQHLKLRVRVQNPNPRALPVKGIEYTMEVEGQEFANGSSAASFVVPAMGEAEFDTNVTAHLAGALMALLGRSGNDAAGQGLAYRLSGRVSLSAGLMRSIPFEQRGRFKLQ
jgi:LEA14-like dessication related protein